MGTVFLEAGAVLMAPLDRFLRETMKLAVGAGEVILMLPGRLSALPLHAAPVNRDGIIFLDHWVVRQVANPRLLLAAHRASQRELLPWRLGPPSPGALRPAYVRWRPNGDGAARSEAGDQPLRDAGGVRDRPARCRLHTGRVSQPAGGAE